MFKSWRIILDVASRNGLILVDTKKIFDLTYNQVKKSEAEKLRVNFAIAKTVFLIQHFCVSY